VTLKTCPNLNTASLLPTKGDVLSHSCEEVLAENYTPRPDLLGKPLQDPDLTLFTNGSFSVNNGEQQAGAAIVTSAQILWAEFIALTNTFTIPKAKESLFILAPNMPF
jgi:hypothetical protein